MYFIDSVKRHLSAGEQIKAMRLSLACCEPFQYLRFSDGELFMLLGQEVRLTAEGAWVNGKQVNKQPYPEHDRKTICPTQDYVLVDELRSSLKHSSQGYVKGLPLPCCVGKELFGDFISQANDVATGLWSTANLVINANYPYFVKKILPLVLNKPIVLVANKRARTSSIPNLISHIRLEDDSKDSLTSYEIKLIQCIDSLTIKTSTEVVVLFAASYISNLLIYRLVSRYPNITMIDIGTALHPILGLDVYRHYLHEYWSNPGEYKYHQCTMEL